MVRKGLAVLALLSVPFPALAVTVSQPYPIVPHTTASASQVQSDFSALYSTVNGYLDAANFANSTGIYASQVVPTSTANGTFGGSQRYTFPQSVLVNGGTTTNGFINNGPATITGTLGVGSINTVSNTNVGGNVSVAGMTNTSGLTSSDIITGETGGTFSQVLPVLVGGSAITSQGNAHIEYISVSAPGTYNFTKPFDSAPICATNSVSATTTTQYVTTGGAAFSCAGM